MAQQIFKWGNKYYFFKQTTKTLKQTSQIRNQKTISPNFNNQLMKMAEQTDDNNN